MIKLNFPFF
jgi:hypothetical protein